MDHSTGRILAIEPDGERARALQRMLRHQSGVTLEVVPSAGEAIRSIAGRVPDLVLTSTFLRPADEAEINAQLRQMQASHVQMITIPYFIDANNEFVREQRRKNVLTFFNRRPASIRPACDPKTVNEQIEHYLKEAFDARHLAAESFEASPRRGPVETASAPLTSNDRELVRPAGVAGLDFSAPRVDRPARAPRGLHGDDRRRSRRRSAQDLPWLWSVRLPWGAEGRLVDISNRGALLETASKIAPGTTVNLQVLGQDTDLIVPARMVRSEVAGVDGLGVRYRVAAAFARDLDIVGLTSRADAPAAAPRVLADVLARVLEEADGGAEPATVRARFERELRALLPVRDIQIRTDFVIPNEETDSIYFTVPRESGARPILQAIFEPDSRPSALEFRLLKAAASLAAVVLEFAPLCDDLRDSPRRLASISGLLLDRVPA